MNYKILSESLHSTADATIDFMHRKWGISKKAVRIEEMVDAALNYRPTLYATAADHHYICVEVAEIPYNNFLDVLVQDCVAKNLPIKLFVAIPRDRQETVNKSLLRKAKENGVGIIEIDAFGENVVHDAIPLSLAKVRPIPLDKVAPKYRESLWKAESTFRSGAPDKGCSIVFDEMEALFRKMAKKLNEKKLWQGKKKIPFDYDNEAWAKLIGLVQAHLDRNRCKCPDLKPAFLARILGFTQYRNETGHKPNNRAALIK